MRGCFLLLGALILAQVSFGANPVLLITTGTNPFTLYYSEILRAEGLNSFDTADLSGVTATTLASYDVAILGEMALTPAQVAMFSNWVNGGGNLIAMRPDKQLASLLGITDNGTTQSNGYLLVNTSTAPGAGIVGQTVQFHGTADQYLPSGATTVATLFSTAAASTIYPAVTLRTGIGAGGNAAAFTYDLARSIVYTRQGNPAWAGQARVQQGGPIRAGDMFFGPASFDPQPDWIDLSKVAIPQADEQQRLLANLIINLNQAKKPLPRFWYFPFGKKAAVIMTGDDHALGGTAGRFDDFIAASPAGCSVANWECIRATSYAYANNPLTNAQAANYVAQGFELAVHINTNCADYTPATLESFFAAQLSLFASQYPSLSAPLTNRTHCIAWDDWSTEAQTELNHGIRLDTNYYYWPASWVQNRSGMFTGSGIPMRFAQLDGTPIDVYQAVTQMPDESGEVFPGFMDSLLDNATGPAGYYGAFTANMHNDYNNCGTNCTDGHASELWAQGIVASAKARGVPVVSAKQMLQWLDGRNGSSFGSVSWSGNALGFTIAAGAGATGLQAMLPTISSAGSLSSITQGGNPIAYSVQTIKGIDYAFFSANPGAYVATYGAGSPPVITAVTATPGNTTATITWATDKSSSSRVDYGTSPTALALSVLDGALVTSHSINLSGLALGTTYYFRVTSVDATGASATSPAIFASPASFTTIDPTPPSIAALNATPGGTGTTSITWTTNKPTNSRLDFGVSPGALNQNQSDPTLVTTHGITLTGLITGTTYYYRATSVDAQGNTVTAPALPNPPATFVQNAVSVWTPTATPTLIDSGDPASVELGMKFRSDLPGLVTSVRFYKAAANTGAHTGHLWTSTGTLLGSAVFTNESASGWQQANFPSPIAINANTTYIVSYFAPGGHYSATLGFFNSGVDSPPLHALANGVDGPNGVFVYGSASGFPNSSANNNNYWVDAVLLANNTPPVISSISVVLNSSNSVRVIWTTDQPASSTVNYGTSPGSLTLTASAGGTSTAHSVVLTGLNPNTTYYYQVTSTNSGGSTVAPASPASFAMPATLMDSALPDFAAGTGTCSPVTLGTGGAVIITPAVSAEFTSATLPSGWVSNVWSAPGGFTLDGTAITVDGAIVASGGAYTSGISLEFTATFSGQPFQNVGLAANPAFDAPWIIFSTGGSGNNLYARINGLPDVLIPGNWLGAPHLFRIDWTPTSVTFSVDGTVVSAQSAVVAANLVLVASDVTPGGGSLSVNWMRLSPYATSCAFQSRVLDAGNAVAWSSMSWTTSTTPATSVAMSYRIGNTPLPDASWTSFASLSASGAALPGSSRYIQYSANLTTTDTTRTPALQAVSIAFSTALPPSITTQPASTTIVSGQTATLTVVAAGAPTLTYQWFSGISGDTSQPAAGATASTYTTPALTTTKSYWARVSNGAGSINSATATVTVNRAASTTTLTASPNPSVAGQTVTLTASVTAGATGSVSFLDGATPIGTATLSAGTATLATTQLGVGSHALTAVYAGDTNFNTSTSTIVTQIVNLVTTNTTLTASPNPSVTGQSVTLSATVSAVAPGSGTVTGSVTFNDGATVLGTVTLAGGSASLAVTTLTGGSHSLTANYAASGNFAASASTAVTQTVNAASTTTTLTSSANPSLFGQSVALTATVSPVAPGSGTVTGSVTFKDGATVLGTVTLSGGSATLPVTALTVASHSLTAAFTATPSYGGSTSTALVQTVKQASTTTTFTISPATSVSGESVTLTATVNPVAPAAGTPTGTVSLLSGTTVLGTATLSGGTASAVVSTLPVGSYTFIVTYGGDTNFTTSSSTASSATVNQASTTTTLVASPNPSVLGQAVSLTATVAVVSPGTGTATGSVTFKDGTTTLGTVTLTNGIAVMSISSLALGSHSLTASYGGSTTFKTSSTTATQTVNQVSTSTTLTASPNPSTLGQTVTLTAAVSPVAPGTGTATGTVTFKDGTTVLGTATLASGSAALTVSTLIAGAHSLTASYGGSTNFAASTSVVVTQTVNQPSTTTVLTPTPSPSTFGQTVTLKATVTVVAPGTGTPTGAVTFKDGSTTLGTATLSGGIASFTTATLSLGAHSLTAVYGGATNFSGSTSAVVTQTVNPPSSTTVLTSSLNPSVYGQSTTLKAVVSPVSPATGTPDGTVTFKDGSTVIGTATLSGGAAITAVSTLTGGSHSLTAVYGGSTNFAASTSSVVTQTVNKASTATGLSASSLTSVFGQPVTLTATISSSSVNMTGTVTFKDGSAVLGTASVSGGTASLIVTTLSPTLHLLTASYAGDTNYSTSTSSVVLSLVSQASSTTKVVPSANPSKFGQSITLVGTVSPVAPSVGTPTGSLTFRDGSTTIGTVTLAGGTASLVMSSLSVGNHSITAVYNDDSNFGTSTSPAVTQVVSAASTSTVLTSSLNPSNFGQTVTFKATVSVVSPGGGTLTGSVVFKDGSTTIGTVTVSNGVANLSTSSLSRGTHTITAAFQDGSSYLASTSTAVTQTVR